MTLLVAQLCLTLYDSMRHQAPLSMEFSSQEYWSGLPFLFIPEDLPGPGIEPGSLVSPALQADSLLSETPGKPPL